MPSEGDEQGINSLAARAIRGDRQAAEDLLSAIRPMVVRYCRARLGPGSGSFATADDVAQEVCVAVFTSLSNYQDRGLPFGAFVYGIAANKVVDAHRRAGRDRSYAVESLPESADCAPTPEEYAVTADSNAQLSALLSSLPGVQREVLTLRVMVGLSSEETGEMLGMAPTAVRVTQHRALAKLRKIMATASLGVAV